MHFGFVFIQQQQQQKNMIQNNESLSKIYFCNFTAVCEFAIQDHSILLQSQFHTILVFRIVQTVYLRRLGAQTMARFFECMPVSCP